MIVFETERLIMRTYQEDDFAAVHSYGSSDANTTFMLFGPNNETETRAFIERAIAATAKVPVTNFQLAAVLKATGKLIGGGNLTIDDDSGEIGWILHQDYWNQGYGTEMGLGLLRLGFDEHKLHRIFATCSTDNHGSYRLMEKIGMRREALLQNYRKYRLPGKLERVYSDEYLYAILRDEWEVKKDIAYYNALPCEFNGFIDVAALNDGEIFLVCVEKQPANPEKKHVPGYNFAICKDGEKIGEIRLRIGYTDGLYYSGQIGYGVDEAHRGKGYVVRACKLVANIAKAHGMEKLLITTASTNDASKRVCEKLGAKLVKMVRLPEWTDSYKNGQRFQNIFEWSI